MSESPANPPDDRRPGFYEFFAGGGMVRAGLGEGWRCLFANDIDPGKARTYCANWGDGDFHLGDIGAVTAGDLPGAARLMWGSFPCQDLSLAGVGAGLGGRRSGMFTPSGTWLAAWPPPDGRRRSWRSRMCAAR